MRVLDKEMRKLGIVNSLYIGFGVLMSLMLLITVIAVIKVAYINNSLTEVNDNYAVKQRYAIDMRGAVHDSAIALRDTVLAFDDNARAEHLRTIEQLQGIYRAASHNMDNILKSGISNTPEETRLFAALNEVDTRASKATTDTIAAINNDDLMLARTILNNEASQAYNDWLDAINAFINYEESTSQVEVQDVRSNASSLLYIMIIATVVSLIAGFVIGNKVISTMKSVIGGSPEKAVRLIKQFAQGDLTIRADSKYKDSILDSINSMAVELSGVMKRISDMTTNLSESAGSLSDLANDNSNFTTLQKQETQKGANGIENLIAGVSNVSSLASNAVETSDAAKQETQKGDDEVQVTIGSINNLAQQVDQVSDAIVRINNDAKEIGKVVQIIAEIAEQTNLLALNAAIEAARAGEHGRGFAVVADEVRALAQRTKESTNGIIDLIKSNQEHTQRAVEIMTSSREQTSISVDQAQKAGDSLNIINSSVGQINDMNAHIASAAQEQTSILNDVNSNFMQITQMAEKALSNSQDMAELSTELTNQANQLEKIISSFKVS